VREMILLTASTRKLVGLEGFGLSIVGRRPVLGDQPKGVRLVR
jgi:GTP cyclohydrolase II